VCGRNLGRTKTCGDILESELVKEIWRFVGQKTGANYRPSGDAETSSEAGLQFLQATIRNRTRAVKVPYIQSGPS